MDYMCSQQNKQRDWRLNNMKSSDAVGLWTWTSPQIHPANSRNWEKACLVSSQNMRYPIMTGLVLQSRSRGIPNWLKASRAEHWRVNSSPRSMWLDIARVCSGSCCFVQGDCWVSRNQGAFLRFYYLNDKKHREWSFISHQCFLSQLQS